MQRRSNEHCDFACPICGITFYMLASQIRGIAGASRNSFSCPCGHNIKLGDKTARIAMEWYAGGYTHPASIMKQEFVIPSAKLEPKLEPEKPKVDFEKQLAEKMKEIDDFLARRGKYAQ